MAFEKVKPCPHCGGPAYLNKSYSSRQRNYLIYVRCEVCGAQGRIYASREDPAENDWTGEKCLDAIKAWNLRTASQDAIERGEVLE